MPKGVYDMKAAVCLHGYFGTVSTGDYSTGARGYEHLQEVVVSQTTDVDFYVHCWQPEMEEKITEIYNPNEAVYEEQIDFDKIAVEHGIDQSYFDVNFPRTQTMYKNAVASRILSFYYSRCESLKLALSGEYDWIITTRFDIGARGGAAVNQIRFFPDNESNFLYTPYWNQMNCGYGDMWFYGSPAIMEEYSTIYERALADFQPHSDYECCATTAWPHSKKYNVYDFNDGGQFTNELVLPKEYRSKDLMAYPLWRVTDSHLYHKWFCMQNGLYEKTRWI